MRAPERFVITITGTRAQVRERSNVTFHNDFALGRQIEWLMLGETIPDDFGRGWRVSVTVEEDTDQCDRA